MLPSSRRYVTPIAVKTASPAETQPSSSSFNLVLTLRKCCVIHTPPRIPMQTINQTNANHPEDKGPDAAKIKPEYRPQPRHIRKTRRDATPLHSTLACSPHHDNRNHRNRKRQLRPQKRRPRRLAKWGRMGSDRGAHGVESSALEAQSRRCAAGRGRTSTEGEASP